MRRSGRIWLISVLTALAAALAVLAFVRGRGNRPPIVSEPLSASLASEGEAASSDAGEDASGAEEASGTEDASASGRTPLYLLGEWEGSVALFEPGGSEPLRVYDAAVAALPAEVRERLRQGIPLYDEEERDRLLEDYTS